VDDRPLGVFDSGIGGLTVLHALRRLLPDEDIVYFGDVARLPYGPRPQEQVKLFAHEVVTFLCARHGVKAVVVACNTASAAALESLRAAHPTLPIVGVIEPGARAAVAASTNRRVGVIATQGTIGSQAYTRAIHAIAPGALVVPRACPRLVPLVEAGQTTGPSVDAVLDDDLAGLVEAGIDTLILGCTHYPLLHGAVAASLRRLCGHDIVVVDSADSTARETVALLDARGLRGRQGASGALQRLYTSGSPLEFGALATRLFGPPIGHVEHAVAGVVSAAPV